MLQFLNDNYIVMGQTPSYYVYQRTFREGIVSMGISVVIITKNEERRIRRCLDSLKGWVDEIIIVDDESSDATAAIARGEYSAKVIIHSLQDAFDRQRNLGMEASSQPGFYKWMRMKLSLCRHKRLFLMPCVSLGM